LYPIKNPDGTTSYQKIDRPLSDEEFSRLPAEGQYAYALNSANKAAAGSPEATKWQGMADTALKTINSKTVPANVPLTPQSINPYVSRTREIPDDIINAVPAAKKGETVAQKRARIEGSLVGMTPEQADKAVATLEKTGEWTMGKQLAATAADAKSKEAINARADQEVLKVKQAHEDDSKNLDGLLANLSQMDAGNQTAVNTFKVKFAEHEIVSGGVKRMNETELKALTQSLGTYGRQFGAWVDSGFSGDMPTATKEEMQAILAAERSALDASTQRKIDNINYVIRHDTSTTQVPKGTADGRTVEQMQKTHEFRNGANGVGWYMKKAQ
jgi:hypothetical protein